VAEQTGQIGGQAGQVSCGIVKVFHTQKAKKTQLFINIRKILNCKFISLSGLIGANCTALTKDIKHLGAEFASRRKTSEMLPIFLQLSQC